MQIHLPKHEYRAIKVQAAEEDQSLSAFMLQCFHAYMRSLNETDER